MALYWLSKELGPAVLGLEAVPARPRPRRPEEYVPNRYAEIVHGAGMRVEYPLVYYPEDVEATGYDGVFEENMVVCLESYVGAVGGREGVKLEQPMLITRDGARQLCDYPFEEHFH